MLAILESSSALSLDAMASGKPYSSNASSKEKPMKNNAFEKLRIIDMTRYLPGGYATQVLADFGAEVIKVEDTDVGDFCRTEEPLRNGMSYYFSALCRNKKSLSINLKDEDVRNVFLNLVESSDVLIESFRPGTVEKLGIDYLTLKKINPSLIFCSLSSYGQKDPRSQKPLHDLNMQAQSGYLSLNGGVKAPLHLCDLATAMVACQSLLLALLQRSETGEGSYIDISMFDSFVWWNSLIDSRWSFQGDDISEESIRFPADCSYYNLYETKDGGKIALGLIEDKFWKSFCELTGHPELIEDRDRPGAYETVKSICASKTAQEWDIWLEDKDLCMAVVIDKTEAIEQILHLEPHMLAYADFPKTGLTLQTNLPHAIRGLQPRISSFAAPPELGENSREILEELGYDAQAIDELIDRGVVRAGGANSWLIS